jgi:lipopolysaccharide/colanic/teichoic acid biosynthesis glycosyltransferase
MRFPNEKVSLVVRVPVHVPNDRGTSSPDLMVVPTWKRVLDITCVVLALPMLAPLMVFLAALIKCVSPGPVLFLQERVGHRGRRFICFKFRTMQVNADTEVHRQHLVKLMKSKNEPMVKMDSQGDSRLIPFGSILRATGLDELPQLLNVLGGEMSLVGPRPCLAYEYESYLPSEKSRFDTLPGLTGLWQVSGKNKTTFSEMIALDNQYSRIKNPWLDLKIMFKTVPALVCQVVETRRSRKLHTPAVPVAPTRPKEGRPDRERDRVSAEQAVLLGAE